MSASVMADATGPLGGEDIVILSTNEPTPRCFQYLVPASGDGDPVLQVPESGEHPCPAPSGMYPPPQATDTMTWAIGEQRAPAYSMKLWHIAWKGFEGVVYQSQDISEHPIPSSDDVQSELWAATSGPAPAAGTTVAAYSAGGSIHLVAP